MRRLSAGLAAALLMPLAWAATAPTPAEVRHYTQPLVQARMRLPNSLQDFTVARIQPSVDDAARFEVLVQFKAKTPFGALTGHEARFAMKRAASDQSLWIVTSE